MNYFPLIINFSPFFYYIIIVLIKLDVMIILISGITGFNEPKTQPGCIPRPCVCVCTHGCNDSRRRVYTLAIWTGRFFQYFPAALFTPFANAYRVSLRAYACYQLRPRCAPPRRGGGGEGCSTRGGGRRGWKKLCGPVAQDTGQNSRYNASARDMVRALLRNYPAFVATPPPLLFFISLPLPLAAFHRRLSGNRLLSLRPFVIFGKKNAWNSLATKKRFNRDFFDLSTLRTTTTTTTSTTITTSLELSLAYVYGFSSYIV